MDQMNDRDEQVLIRFKAMVRWMEQAEAGAVPLQVAHTAVGELLRACETFLYRKAA